MTPLQAKKRFIALMKPYWLKDLKESRGPKLSRKQYKAKYGDDEWYDANMEDWEWWNNHVKTVQSGKYGEAETGGDTILREALPHSYWAFINYLPIKWEGYEKYHDEPYETMYVDIDYCIYNREVPWSQWSAADKRKLRKLENNNDMDFFDYFDQKEEIEGKYNKTVRHRTEASKMNCKHCGPYLKNRRNINNWDILSVAEQPDFYAYWEYPAALKKQVKALIPALKGVKVTKPKKAPAKAKSSRKAPKARAKTTAKKPKTKAKSGRKAPEISATRRKIGTRMRGNDGNMWEVKPAGKSQRWIRGAENWGGDPEGQLAQALERARNAPAPAPLEITELPKLCQLCGDESPQAFGLYDEDDLLIGEIWACDGGCAQPLADSRNLSFGAEGDYNDFISDMESVMEKYGELVHFESDFNPSDRILNVSFALEVENSDFDEVVFEAENTTQKFIVGEQTPLPDADSWLIYHHPIEDLPENHVRSFMSGMPGQKVDLSHYELVAEVLGGYQPFAITQNISDSWHKNSTTIANLGNSFDGYRSTSVSDVVCDSQTGQCFLVGNFGYIALEPVDSFEAPLARHSLKRFQPSPNARKKASYWRKKGKDYIWGRNRER